jgi:peptidoglycan/xylan/chitin deacetylase (PgdA/CDA1 family)
VLLTVALLGALAPIIWAPATVKAATRGCRAGHVALTFDDGPSPTVTPRLLATLERLHVPATFFMVGERVAASPSTARLVERSGFLVGNHSYRHQDLTGLSTEEIEATIRSTAAALRDAGVQPTGLMRPPYGAVNARVYAAIRRTHLRPVLWNVDPRDWAGGTADQIAARVLGQLHRGDNIVLQHDGVRNSPSSVAAVPRIVSEARRRGYCFVGLDEDGRPGFPTARAALGVQPVDRHVAEGDRLHITVALDREVGRDTWVRIHLSGRTASVRRDLVRPAATVRIPAGRLNAEVVVRVRRDRLVEGTERFDVRLTDGVGLVPERGKITVVIDDADQQP